MKVNKGYCGGSGDWSFRIKEGNCRIDFSIKKGYSSKPPLFTPDELIDLIGDLEEIYDYLADQNSLKVKTYIRERGCEFDIYRAIADAELWGYGDIILGLLEQKYGFESGDREKGKKWYVHKDGIKIKPKKLRVELTKALNEIFDLLNQYKEKINK